jgi:hypothetical protein
MRILRVKNYDKYQTHRTKNPPWIKLYKSLLTDMDFLRLDIDSRYIYVGLLILAAETGNRVVNDPAYLCHRLAIERTRLNLTPLFRSGLLCASERTVRRMNCHSETERETETEREGEAQAAPHTLTQVLIKQPRRKPETEWPEGFMFNDKHKSIADGLGLNVNTEFIKFKDKALGKGWMYKDWDAGFRTWLNNAYEFKQERMK